MPLPRQRHLQSNQSIAAVLVSKIDCFVSCATGDSLLNIEVAQFHN